MVRVKNVPDKNKNKSFTTVMMGKKQFHVRNKLLKQIRKLQNSTSNCVPRAPFFRLIREILQNEQRCRTIEYRVHFQALQCLQEAAELYVVGLFEDTNTCAAHANRITIRPNDMKLALTLRGANDIFNH